MIADFHHPAKAPELQEILPTGIVSTLRNHPIITFVDRGEMYGSEIRSVRHTDRLFW